MRPVLDLAEQDLRPRAKIENVLFPRIERPGADRGIVGELDAPEQADQRRAGIELGAGGEEAEEPPGTVDDLIEFALRKDPAVFADEPVRAPWIAAVGATEAEPAAQGGARAVGDDQQVEAALHRTPGRLQAPAVRLADRTGDFAAPTDLHTGFTHRF